MDGTAKLEQILFENAWRTPLYAYAQKQSGGKWLPYKHLVAISNIVAPLILQGGARIIINMPPRHGKSELFSHWLPVWFFEHFPERSVIMTSYSAEKAADYGRKVRNTIYTLYREGRTWTEPRRQKSASDNWETTKDGKCFTSGMLGAITGRGGDLIIIDDPLKNEQDAASALIKRRQREWFDNTLYTRLEPNASIVVIMTRWAEDDMTGYLLTEHPDKWTHIKLPAEAEDDDDLLERQIGEPLCPERFSSADFQTIKANPQTWAGLYQQRPSPREGNIYKRRWWRYWSEGGGGTISGEDDAGLFEQAIEAYPGSFDMIFQSWDLTFKKTTKGSYIVGQVWGRKGADYYLLDQYRSRAEYIASKAALIGMVTKWPETSAIIIEDKANAEALYSDLKQEVEGIILISPSGDKVSRAQAAASAAEARNVVIPAPTRYSWVNDFLAEVTVFPNAKHDDQMDAFSQAINWARSKSRKTDVLTSLSFGNLTKQGFRI